MKSWFRKYLEQSAHIVEAWTVDDLAKAFRQFQDGIQKLEVSIAKDKKGFWSQSEQTKRLDEIRKQLARIGNQLNRLLGVSL